MSAYCSENDSHRLFITASFGVSSLLKGRDVTADDLMEAADQALARAKKLGKNRVEADR
jgi:PleD family two-component response regulator